MLGTIISVVNLCTSYYNNERMKNLTIEKRESRNESYKPILHYQTQAAITSQK